MIKSMTGYGRARQELHKREITVEVRAVNNRYLDCGVKMPRMYAFAEDAVKQCVQKAVSWGKVDVFITVDASAADVTQVTVNRELAGQYAAALNELAEMCGPAAYEATPEVLARFPDVLSVTNADEDLETVSADLCAVLDAALAAFNEMRGVEGARLAEDIGNRLRAIEAYTGQVEARSPETVAEYAMDNGHYVMGTGTAWALLEEYPVTCGVGVEQPAVSEQTMKNALDKGGVIICSMSQGDFTAAGHFVVIYGYDSSGFYVNDSNCVARSREKWEYDRLAKQIKHMWIYS